MLVVPCSLIGGVAYAPCCLAESDPASITGSTLMLGHAWCEVVAGPAEPMSVYFDVQSVGQASAALDVLLLGRSRLHLMTGAGHDG